MIEPRRTSFDKLNFAELKRNVAIAAVTAYALADAAARIGHRQTRAEVEQLLKDTGLEQILKTGWRVDRMGRRRDAVASRVRFVFPAALNTPDRRQGTRALPRHV